MNVHRADDDNLNHDHELDALLDRARWPEPPPQAVTRLREQWRELSQGRARRMLPLGWLAAAAALVLAIGGTWFVWTQGGRVRPEIAHHAPTAPRPRTAPRPPIARSLPPPPQAQRAEIVPQAPTPRETLAVLGPAGPIVDVRLAVKRAIDTASADDYAAALASLRGLRANALERELALAFATMDGDSRRRAAMRLLADTGGPPSLPLLTRAGRDPRFAAEAMPGVARLGGIEPLVAIARTSQPAPRREAIGQLLALGSEPGVAQFLSLVLDDATRNDALAALRESSSPPVETLIAALDHAHIDRRFAAAKSLGALCNRPEVGEALRRMVSTNRHRREAFAALLSCPSNEAAVFINAARTRASIDAEVRAVQTELQRIF